MQTKTYHRITALFFALLIAVTGSLWAFATEPSIKIEASFGDTLADLALPEGYTWLAAAPQTIPVGELGAHTFKAVHLNAEGQKESVDVSVTVGQASIASADVVPIEDKDFMGKPIRPSVEATFKGKRLVLNKDYEISYQDNTNVGKAKIILTGIGNFKDTKTVEFNIVSIAVTAVELDLDEPKVPTYTANDIERIDKFSTYQKVTLKNRDVIVEFNNGDRTVEFENGDVIKIEGGKRTVTFKTGSRIKIETNGNGEQTVTFKNGTRMQLKAVVQPSDATYAAVEWSSSNPAVASVDENGLVTARANGSAVITVKTLDGGLTDSCTVAVFTSVKAVSLSRRSVILRRNQTHALKATVQPSNASEPALIWTSSDEHVVRVDNNGKLYAIGRGRAVVYAETEDGTQLSVSCDVRVFSLWQWLRDLFTGRLF